MHYKQALGNKNIHFGVYTINQAIDLKIILENPALSRL